MGIKEDLERFKDIGEEKRQDLKEFIKHGQLNSGGGIKIPIKVIDLPEFEYNMWDKGGVGVGEGEQGDPIEMPGEPPQPGQDDEGDGDDDEAGEEGGEHGHYEMSPEEFAEELDEELGLDLEPKGKQIKQVQEGALVDLVRSGPDSTLDFERMYKKGMKRYLAVYFDEDYMREVLKVEDIGPASAFQWARESNIPVSKDWLVQEYKDIPSDRKAVYDTIDDIEMERKQTPNVAEMDSIPLRERDKRHKYPEITKEYEKNAVIVFIRDVSGSMREHKRELVERIFTPLDWYLQGKYDNAEFVYIAHDAEAWEVDEDEFFGIKSGGGTRISTAYELAQEILESDYPWSSWNRYIFAAGDGENIMGDTEGNVIPIMEDVDTNLQAYLQVEESEGQFIRGDHGEKVEEHFQSSDDNVTVAYAKTKDEVIDCIEEILKEESE